MTGFSSPSRGARPSAAAALLSLLLAVPGCAQPPPPMESILLTATLPVQALQLSTLAKAAAQGNLMAFDELKERQVQLRSDLAALQTGDAQRGIAAPKPTMEAQLRSLQSAWTEVDLATTRLLGLQDVVDDSAEKAQRLAMMVPAFQSRADELFRSLAESGAPAAQVVHANRLLLLPERVQRRLPSALAGGPEAVSSFDALARDCAMLQRAAISLREGSSAEAVPALTHPTALEALTQIDEMLPELQQTCSTLVSEAHKLVEANELAEEIGIAAARLQDEAGALLQQYR